MLDAKPLIERLQSVSATNISPTRATRREVTVNVEDPNSLINSLIYSLIEGFLIPVSSLKVFGHFTHSERRMIYLGKSIKPLQNDTIVISCLFSFRVIQPSVSWHTFKSFMFVFINSFSLQTFSRQSVIKVPNQYRTHMTFSYKIQVKTFTRPDMSFYAR